MVWVLCWSGVACGGMPGSELLVNATAARNPCMVSGSVGVLRSRNRVCALTLQRCSSLAVTRSPLEQDHVMVTALAGRFDGI